MKLIALVFLVTSTIGADPTVLHVSEGGDKRVAVYTMNETTGDLTRAGTLTPLKTYYGCGKAPGWVSGVKLE